MLTYYKLASITAFTDQKKSATLFVGYRNRVNKRYRGYADGIFTRKDRYKVCILKEPKEIL